MNGVDVVGIRSSIIKSNGFKPDFQHQNALNTNENVNERLQNSFIQLAYDKLHTGDIVVKPISYAVNYILNNKKYFYTIKDCQKINSNVTIKLYCIVKVF